MEYRSRKTVMESFAELMVLAFSDSQSTSIIINLSHFHVYCISVHLVLSFAFEDNIIAISREQ